MANQFIFSIAYGHQISIIFIGFVSFSALRWLEDEVVQSDSVCFLMLVQKHHKNCQQDLSKHARVSRCYCLWLIYVLKDLLLLFKAVKCLQAHLNTCQHLQAACHRRFQ